LLQFVESQVKDKVRKILTARGSATEIEDRLYLRQAFYWFKQNGQPEFAKVIQTYMANVYAPVLKRVEEIFRKNEGRITNVDLKTLNTAYAICSSWEFNQQKSEIAKFLDHLQHAKTLEDFPRFVLSNWSKHFLKWVHDRQLLSLIFQTFEEIQTDPSRVGKHIYQGKDVIIGYRSTGFNYHTTAYRIVFKNHGSYIEVLFIGLHNDYDNFFHH